MVVVVGFVLFLFWRVAVGVMRQLLADRPVDGPCLSEGSGSGFEVFCGGEWLWVVMATIHSMPPYSFSGATPGEESSPCFFLRSLRVWA